MHSLLSVVVLQIDQVILCLYSHSESTKTALECVLRCDDIVVRKQINFQSAVLRSERSSCCRLKIELNFFDIQNISFRNTGFLVRFFSMAYLLLCA